MSVVNIWIDIVADIDSSTITGANSCNKIIISNIIGTILYSGLLGIHAAIVVHFNTILLTPFDNCLSDSNVRKWYYLGCFGLYTCIDHNIRTIQL